MLPWRYMPIVNNEETEEKANTSNVENVLVEVIPIETDKKLLNEQIYI